MKTLVLFTLFISFYNANAGACLETFRNQFQTAQTWNEKQNLIVKLSRKDIQCLYREASVEAQNPSAPRLSLSDFYDLSSNETPRVEKFFGKSTIWPYHLGFEYFEKHFFYITASGERKLYGYNYSKSGQFLGSLTQNHVAGPGFLSLDLSQDRSYLNGDYTRNFEVEIPHDQFDALQGRPSDITKVVNNADGNPVYGKLVDRFYKINSDVFVNEGLNRQADGSLKHLVNFILLRKPHLDFNRR